MNSRIYGFNIESFMRKRFTIVLIYLFCNFSLGIHSEEKYSYVTEFANALQREYGVSSVALAMSDIYDDLRKSSVALRLQKLLSQKDIYSMPIAVKELQEAMYYYENQNITLSFNIIVLENFKDFNSLINITKLVKVAFSYCLVIFDSGDKKLMDICKNPQENYFDVDFDDKLLVACINENIPIREWFSIFPDKVKTFDFITYDPKWGMKLLSRKSMYDRRHSLDGLNLRVTGLNVESTTVMSGLFGELLKLIADHGNFTLVLQPEQDVNGIFNPITKKWNGIARKLIENETDIGLQFAMTQRRLSVLDFSAPVIATPTVYLIKKPNSRVLQWSTYYQAFGKKSIVCLISLCIFAIIVVGCMMVRVEQTNQTGLAERLCKSIREASLNIWGILCNKPVTDFTDNYSLRIAYFSMFLLSVMIFCLYSAVLTSYLASLRVDMPFDSLDGFINDGTYKLMITLNGNILEDFYSGESEIVKKLKNFLLPMESLPKNIFQAYEKLCSDEKLVFYIDDFSAASNKAPCEFIAFDKGYTYSIGYAFQKNSPYIGLINHYIYKMQSHKIVRYLQQRFTNKEKFSNSSYEQITLHSVIFIFSILLIGIFLAIVILCFERINFYSNNNSRNRKITRNKILQEFITPRINYWTPLIRPEKTTKKQYFDFIN